MHRVHQFRQQIKKSTPDRSAPYQVKVQAVDTAREQLLFDDSSKESPIRYPFTSANSWIRVMPSAGSRAVVAYSQISKRLELIGYEMPQAETLISKYQARQGLYRELKEGEAEIMSSGAASSFWGSYPVRTDRAGVVSTKHDGLKLEYAVRAPTLVWRGVRNRPDVIGHEMRVGTVKRATSPNKEAYALKIGSLPEAGNFIYANEYMLALNADVTDAPLIDIRSGDVFDDSLSPGYPMATPLTGVNSLPLRHRAKYFVTIEPGTIGVPLTSTDLEIDNLGNVALTLSKLSIIGLAVKVPLGKVLLACGLDMTLDAKLGIVLTSLGKIQIKGTTGVEIATPASVTISGDAGVSIKTSASASIQSTGPTSIEATGPVTVSGKMGVSLKGAAGGAGLRPINTLPIDPVTGIVTWTDATVMA